MSRAGRHIFDTCSAVRQHAPLRGVLGAGCGPQLSTPAMPHCSQALPHCSQALHPPAAAVHRAHHLHGAHVLHLLLPFANPPGPSHLLEHCSRLVSHPYSVALPDSCRPAHSVLSTSWLQASLTFRARTRICWTASAPTLRRACLAPCPILQL